MPTGTTNVLLNALERWSCSSEMNYELQNESDISDLTSGVGEITVGTLSANLIADSRIIFDNGLIECSAGNGLFFSAKKIGVVFSNTLPFSIESTDTTCHIESVLMHELGHNHFLGHVTDSTSTMFPTANINYLDTMLLPVDIDAASHVAHKCANVFSPVCSGANFSAMTLFNCLTGILNSEKYKILIVYPNPSRGVFKVEAESSFIGEVFVYNINGRKLYNERFENRSKVEIDLLLASGNYILIVDAKEGPIVERIIID